MQAFLHQLRATIRLHFRNTMALIYGYIFPTVFLVAFWALYRYDQVPLVRHIGELLTITILGGACFGLPTSMVSERERGVWRRYRLTPVPTIHLVLSTVIARYLLLVIGGALQIALAMSLGMPLPRHPLEIWVAFTFVAFAFLGLGLVIAMLADNVPAVQALGQCLFLPMLIIGGVAVPLTTLPDWAVHISAFLPGRYAVEAIQATVTGAGLRAEPFSLVALTVIGAAGCLSAAKLFRWDQQQRFASLQGKAWIGVALLAWAGVGVAAESRGRVSVAASSPTTVAATIRPTVPVARPTAAELEAETNATTPAATSPVTASPGARNGAPATRLSKPAPAQAPATSATKSAAEPTNTDTARPDAPGKQAQPGPDIPLPASWQVVTLADIEREIVYDRLPLDRSVVTPIATADQEPEADLSAELAGIQDALLTWPPGLVADKVQQTRNLLYVLGVHDVAQTALEAYLPAIVFDRIMHEVPREDLLKALFWIAIHPEQGPMITPDDTRDLAIRGVPTDEEEVRNRAAIYAVKLLGRLTGHIK